MRSDTPLFKVWTFDRSYFQERLEKFLPDRIIDIHSHIWLESFRGDHQGQPQRTVSWPGRVARENRIEHLQETYDLMFPGKRVTPLIFGNALYPSDDLEGGNRYVSECSCRTGAPALLFSDPSWTGEEVERRIIHGGFLGLKPYLTRADCRIPADEIEIYDFLPPHQLEVLNRHGWIAMLHIPRNGRLRDPRNLAQLCEIDERYPQAQVIVAHVGRAYCLEDMGSALEVLSHTHGLLFDISANTNSEIFEELLRAIPIRRILFGSDLPVSRMRTHRICEEGIYVNLVPPGLYGDAKGDPHMREVSQSHAEDLTFFLYEEIEAFRKACERTGIDRSQVEDIFFCNALRLLIRAGARPERLA